jgi:uncharacterized protein YigE (DUF2233 family)
MKTSLIVIRLITLTFFSNVAIAVECSTIGVTGKRVTACYVDVLKEKLQLFHRDENGQAFKRLNRLESWLKLQGRKLAFAMNAGMFHSDFSAVGLFVSGGRQFVPLNMTDGSGNFFLKPNGVFVVTNTHARVIESSEYLTSSEPVILATQSGPLLVQRGKIHPKFNIKSESRLIRNGIGISESGVAIFAISGQPVSFYEFAKMFRDTLHCPDALYLDGTISSLYASGLKRSDSKMDLGPILAVTE